ncbi:hypothetical protein KC19_6G171500 [Ceratodon purpureus]|uniref:GH16 domain-containing protein n=1 Tax=Ceratodon purpureus TaxID=3225 RepID=A0A8T0HFL6_CERPU|nr:hypothetical protein KC19_6G171500 [Ceratodon purpureus]
MSMEEPCVAAKAGHSWRNVFWEDFTSPGCLEKSFRHPMGKGKWKWDAASNKEIHWEPACAQIVNEAHCHGGKVLRVCVFSDWFHRIDRLATKQQFGYGYYEARCRFKGAEGMHSAFWLLPEGMWDKPVPPGEIQGGVEIDVVEHRGKDGNRADVSRQGNTAVHWGGYGAHHRSVAYKQMNLPDAPSAWAKFGLLHEPGGMKWYWNGREVNSCHVWSPMPNSIYFSTEVNESGGWAGQDLSSYGPLENPTGYIEVDYCGFWELASSSELSAPVPYRDPAMSSKVEQAESGSHSETLSHTFTVRQMLRFEDLEALRGVGDGEQSWFVPFPAGRVIREPRRAQTLLSVETKHIASLITEWSGTQFAHEDYTLEVQEVCANGLRLRYAKRAHSSPHVLDINVIVHDSGAAEEEATQLRAQVRELEQRSRETESRMQERIDQLESRLATELSQLKELVQNSMSGSQMVHEHDGSGSQDLPSTFAAKIGNLRDNVRASPVRPEP